MSFQNMNHRERNKAIWRLIRQRLQRERIVVCILACTLFYALVSNFFSHCIPLDLPQHVLDIMDSIDQTLRNCCYGVIASISFYLINDFYKNAYKSVDIYNEMYPSLYNLWLKTSILIIALNKNAPIDSLDNGELHLSIIKNLCKQPEGETTRIVNREVPSDMFHLMYTLWNDAFEDKNKYLDVYGHIINRVEYTKLNDKELDILIDRLKEYLPDDEQIVKGDLISIRDYDIQRGIYLILKYKSDLALMVNKYSVYYYGSQRGIRKEAF